MAYFIKEKPSSRTQETEMRRSETFLTPLKPGAGGSPLAKALGLAALSFLLSACETPVLYQNGGKALLEGDKIAQTGDYSSAAAYYEEAAKSPSPDIAGRATYNLALISREKGDNARFQTYLGRAAATGMPAAQLELAELYEKSGQPDEKIKALYLPLASQSAAASSALLKMALKERNTEEAARYARQTESTLLDQIATDGDADGGKSLMLARLYAEHGALLGQDRKAEEFYRRSIAKGNAKAATELARFWLAEGSRPSAKEDAFALMLQAAEAGNTSAVKYVASAYAEGNGVSKDDQKARYWYAKLPESARKKPSGSNPARKKLSGDSSAPKGGVTRKSLEDMLMSDSRQKGKELAHASVYAAQTPDALFSAAEGLKNRFGKESPESLRSYEIAAEFGSGKAALHLAKDAESQPAGQQSAEEINRWYRKAAELGEGKAMLLLARRAKVGDGQEKSDAEAFSWLLKAAEAGEPEGQYETGLAYARGIGVEKDIGKARHWLEKAKAGGYVLAVDVLESVGGE